MDTPTHDQVQLLAFQLWQERGEPFGTPEVDWIQAEQQLTSDETQSELTLSALAKTIGSAIGSVAALVTANP